MRCITLINTPAHVHVYKHAVRRLLDEGHDVLALARDYGCTLALLERYDLPYECYGRLETAKGSLVSQLPRHFGAIARASYREDADVVLGMSLYAAVAGLASRARTVLILDSEVTGLDHAISRPLVDAFLTPHSFRKDLGSKHYQFRGFKECAYLHPDVFEPDADVRSALGVGPDERFALVRLNAFGSHHDVGVTGLGPERRRRLLERLAEHATVFVSDEGDDLDFDAVPARPYDLHPARIHDVLAEASLLVADTQTMVTEAALLGTPAVRSNSFVGEEDMGNFLSLEDAGLVRNVPPEESVTDAATALLEDPETPRRWTRRRDAFMADKVDLTELIVDTVERVGDVERVPQVAPYAGPETT